MTKPKRRDYSCWCLRQQREFSVASRLRTQNHHGWGGRKSHASTDLFLQAEPGLPSKAGENPPVSRSSRTGRAAPPGGPDWAMLPRSPTHRRPHPPAPRPAPPPPANPGRASLWGGAWGRKSHLRTPGTEEEVTLLEGPTRSTAQSAVCHGVKNHRNVQQERKASCSLQ